jgi:N-acetylmuramoyl-L-alanine amidase
MRLLAKTLCLMLAAGCSSLPIVDEPSANQSSRINYLVLHFTSEHFAESMRLLTEPTDRPVSVHYLVPEPGDETYTRPSLEVHRLVAEERRARHAGTSYWGGTQSLNDSSIGIEIVNRSTCVNDNPQGEMPTPEAQTCTFLDFPDQQIDLVIRLAKYVLERNPDIDPVDVVGHGDIAPTRRLDPGPKFPWKRLYDNGIGAWYDDSTVMNYRQRFKSALPSLKMVQEGLLHYGYDIEVTGDNDVQTRFVIRAFQMHFRPSNISGRVDAETAAILFALREKYRPENVPID